MVVKVKEKCDCLMSYHNFNRTPPLEELKDIVERQIAAGADICKVATMARSIDDNITILELIKSSVHTPFVAMAMGETGQVSRILGPFMGAAFGYVALEPENCSSAGQLTEAQMTALYRIVCQ